MTKTKPSMPKASVAYQPQTPASHKYASRRIMIGIQWFLAIVLIWAGLSKLADPTSFYGAMLEYRLPFPTLLLKGAAVILPWMEILCGLLLVAGIARKATSFWVCAMFATFLILVGQAFLRGLDLSCGCLNLGPLGISADSKLAHTLESAGFATLRNMVFLSAALFLWKFSKNLDEPSQTLES